jgi:hypothetical protein
MAKYAEVLAVLPAFRNDVTRKQQLEPVRERGAFVARGAFSAFASPLSNVHAIGAGVRQKGGKYDPNEVVLKMFVFDKVRPEDLGAVFETQYANVPVDVEHLPVQVVRARGRRTQTPPVGVEVGLAGAESAIAAVAPKQRERRRPVTGGISISPIDAQYVGTVGCFLQRRRVDGLDTFALSNNHVLADTNRLPRGTPIVQPGPEQQPVTPRADVFATLSGAIPIRFPASPDTPVVNRFDAAIARVTDMTLIQTGTMFGGVKYDPSSVVPPVPGMRVVKAGRTTGVTRGIITATNTDGVQVNYGSRQLPRIAVFDDTIEIVSQQPGTPFSLPGDSGSVILEEATGHPVALLFAGDGVHTTACELGRLCRRLRAWPV